MWVPTERCAGCNVAFVSHRGRRGGFSLLNLFAQSSCVGTGGDGGEMASSKGHFFQLIAQCSQMVISKL